MPLQQPYPYPQQGACPQAAQGVQHPHYGEPVIPPYPESQDMREDAPYPPQDEPAYRPEDYEEYPDFPQSMLDPKYSPYQTV